MRKILIIAALVLCFANTSMADDAVAVVTDGHGNTAVSDGDTTVVQDAHGNTHIEDEDGNTVSLDKHGNVTHADITDDDGNNVTVN